MSTKYHYDKNGNHTGSTSDEPPKNGCSCLGIICLGLFILFAYLIKACH